MVKNAVCVRANGEAKNILYTKTVILPDRRNMWSSTANFTAKDRQSKACAFCKLVFDRLIPASNLHLVDSAGPDMPTVV